MVSIAELRLVVSGKDEVSQVLDKVEKSGGNLGKTLAIAGTAAAGFGLAVTGALFKVGSDFDKAFDTIAIGTGATGENLKALEGNFKTVFTSVPTDMQSAATAIADLNTRTGATGTTLEAMSKQMLEMTRLTGGDLGANIKSVTRLMGDWGIANEDGGSTMDKLFVASQATGGGIDQLASQMVQFGAPLRQLGFGFETAVALLAKFEKEGVNAELVMGSLRIALGKMARDGEPAEETLNRTVEAIKNAGSVSEANAMALELFGARAGPDMAAAIREGRFAVDDLVAMMGESEGAIEDTARRTADFGEKWTLFKNKVLTAIQPVATAVFDFAGKFMDAFSKRALPVLSAFGTMIGDVGSSIGSYLIGPIREAIDVLDSFAQYLRFVWEDGDTLNDFLADMPGFLKPVVEGIGELTVMFQERLLPHLQRFADWFKNNESAMQAAGAAIGGILVAAFLALAVAAGSAAVSVLVALAPVLLIVAAVAALSAGIFLLVKHWDELSERYPVLQEGLDAVKDAFASLVRFLQADVVPALQRVGDVAVAAARFLVEHWGTIWSLIKPAVDNFIAGIKLLAEVVSSTVAIVVAIINGDWSRAWQEAKDILNAFKDFFIEALDNLVELMKALGPLLLDAAKLAMEALWEGVQWVWTNLVWPGFKAMPGLIVDALGALGSLLLQSGKDILQGMFDGLTEIADRWVWPFFRNLPRNIADFFVGAGKWLLEIGEAIMQGLWEGLKAKWEEVKGWLGSLKELIPFNKGPIEEDRKILEPIGRAIMEGLAAGLDAGWQPVATKLQGYADAIAVAFSGWQPVAAALSAGDGGWTPRSTALASSGLDTMSPIGALPLREIDGAHYQVGAESYYGHLREQMVQPFGASVTAPIQVNVQVDRQTIVTAVIEPWMTEQLTTGARQHGVVN